MGGWAVAQSPIMITTITLNRVDQKRLRIVALVSPKVSPQLNEPLYTRPVRTGWCESLPAKLAGELLDCAFVPFTAPLC